MRRDRRTYFEWIVGEPMVCFSWLVEHVARVDGVVLFGMKTVAFFSVKVEDSILRNRLSLLSVSIQSSSSL